MILWGTTLWACPTLLLFYFIFWATIKILSIPQFLEVINFECQRKKGGQKIYITHNLSMELCVKLNVFLDLFFKNKNGE